MLPGRRKRRLYRSASAQCAFPLPRLTITVEQCGAFVEKALLFTVRTHQ